MTLVVDELRAGDEPDWDEFVSHSGNGNPYQLTGWKRVFQHTFGHHPYYLLARSQGQIVGVLPLFIIESRLRGRSLTTLPGGFCASSEEAATTLIEAAKRFTREQKAAFLVVKDTPIQYNAGLLSVCDHSVMLRDLPEDSESLWKSLDKKLRRHLRIGLDSEVECVMGDGKYLEDFYTVHREFLKEMGTPTFGSEFMRNVVRYLGDMLLICCLRLNGQLIGAYLAFVFSGTIYGAWGGSLRAYFDYRPNHLIYWNYMKYGVEHGLSCLNLGRSLNGSGHYEFKKGWGAQPQPIHQQYFLNTATSLPAGARELQTGAPYRLFVNVWKHLPLPVAEILGPPLRRHLPFA